MHHSEVLKASTIYGISIGDLGIMYNFKTTKKPETFMKSFINQHIRKYEMSLYGNENKTKKDIVESFMSDRVTKYNYYTTLYGIGTFCYFTRDITKATKEMKDYLNSKGIPFSNEFSDANWVYRFVINKPVEDHNDLLENFNL